MAVPRELLLTVAVVAAVSCGAVAWVGSTGSWQPLGASRTVLVARPAGHTKNVMSSMREAEHDKRVMIARAVRLEGSIASLARALKRQQTSQLGDAKALPELARLHFRARPFAFSPAAYIWREFRPRSSGSMDECCSVPVFRCTSSDWLTIFKLM